MKDLKTTNTLLLIIVIPIVFYLLKVLSFIFIPLTFAMFLALMFVPFMRWINRKNIPKFVGILFVIIIIFTVLKVGGLVIKLSINEIVSAQGEFFEKAQHKIVDLVKNIESFFGIERLQNENMVLHYLKNFKPQNFGTTLNFLSQTISMTLMTAFFVILLLSESINLQNVMSKILFKQNISSIKAFIKIEKDIITFVKVKFIISLMTGIGFSLACIFFNVSFPIFWGLLAFLINFVQMIGSVISVIMLTLFAFIELDPTGILLFFILTIIAVQVLMGGILEPVFMGKAFSLNVVTVLIMLMLWGFIWGIPGLIMSIPITVFIKILLEQSPKTKIIAELMSGPKRKIFSLKKLNNVKKVLLLLADGFETLEASAFIDVIGWNLFEGDKSTELFSCGFRKELNTTFNQKFIVNYLIDEVNINTFDALAIPGGFEISGFYKDAYHEKFLDIIRAFDKQKKPIASICVGALPIGKSGILKDRFATTYNFSGTRQKQLSEFGAKISTAPIVINENIITSWGPSTAVEVAFNLLEMLTNKENTKHIRKVMGY